jgi:WhiB family redox-sensing transcriptional regulator
MTGPIPKLQIPNFENALCVNTPSEWFYEEDTVNPQLEVVELARSVCASCVERVRCLDWAFENEKYGMWGGFTANERAAVKGKREHDLGKVREQGWI